MAPLARKRETKPMNSRTGSDQVSSGSACMAGGTPAEGRGGRRHSALYLELPLSVSRLSFCFWPRGIAAGAANECTAFTFHTFACEHPAPGPPQGVVHPGQ